MTATDVIREAENLPKAERLQVLRHLAATVNGGDAAQQKVVERLLRRLENPGISEAMFQAMEDVEDGRVVDMETALYQKPPWRE
jgi:lipopolysaccharide biosynthesis regulator YciM